MAHVVHWLIRYKNVDRVTAIVRRGPVERKYNPKEIRSICANMDIEGIRAEFERIKDRLAKVGQNPDDVLRAFTDEFTKCEPKVTETKMGFRFLPHRSAFWLTVIIGCVDLKWKITGSIPRVRIRSLSV